MKQRLIALVLVAIMLTTTLCASFAVFAEEPAAEVVVQSEVQAISEPEPEQTQIPTPVPTDVPTPEPTPEPTAEPTPVPTEEPTPIPTEEPTPVPTEEPTPVPTETPTEAPTQEPTAEPTAEPTVEPTAEPTAEPVELTVALTTSQKYAHAGRIAIETRLNTAGGVAPYQVEYQLYKGSSLQSSKQVQLTESGSSDQSWMPIAYGEYTVKAIVTDAAGARAESSITLPVAGDDPDNSSEWEKKLTQAIQKAKRAEKKENSDYGWREWLLVVAESQIGYRESQIDFIIDDEGKKQGTTLYGKWYHSSHAEWCAMFASWCLNNAGIRERDFPYESNCQRWKEALERLNAYEDNEDAYTPQPGDLIFFNWENGNQPQHVGIVKSVRKGIVTTIEGNSGKRVRENEYKLTDRDIVGYANLETLMRRAGVLPEATPAPTEASYYNSESIAVEPVAASVAVNKGTLTVREQPDKNSKRLASLKNGETVTVLGNSGKWAQIETSKGIVGYVSANFLKEEEPTEEPSVEPTEEPTPEPTVEPTSEPTVEPTVEPTIESTEAPAEVQTAIVSLKKDSNTLTVREQPDKNSKRLASLKNGETVTILGDSGKWAQIETSKGIVGYVSANFLKVEEVTEEPMVEPTEEPTPEPTVEPTEQPTEAPAQEPTPEPTIEPTEAPAEVQTAIVSLKKDSNTLTVREQPDKNSKRLASLKNGETVTILGYSGKWAQIETSKGIVGYVSANFLKKEATETTEQPTEASTQEPTPEPTAEPTPTPTAELTPEPTVESTEEPTVEPTEEPTPEPTSEPTEQPTASPAPEYLCGYDAHEHTTDCCDPDGNLICDLIAHAHSEACLTAPTEQPTASPAPEYLCGYDAHEHTPDCCDADGNLICGLIAHAHSEACLTAPTEQPTASPVPEYLCGHDAHEHTSDCYDPDGNLICGLIAHAHSEACLTAPTEQPTASPAPEYFCGHDAHEHTPDCYNPDGILWCGTAAHVHTDACLAEPAPLYCGQTEHVHSPECFNAQGILICSIPQHTHDATCLTAPVYYCGLEVHTHGEGCYDADGNLICTIEEHTHDATCLTATVYYCGLEAHTHGEGCYDANGNLICTLEEHIHDATCLTAPVYYCGLEAHVHGEGCYDADGNLICTLEEHIHDETCLVAPEEPAATVDPGIAEAAYGDNWKRLRDSGWFEQYSGYAGKTSAQTRRSSRSANLSAGVSVQSAAEGDTSPSSVQVDEPGGSNSADDVTVSKTIAGTDIENVFDITLKVQTTQKIDEVISEPDMAVVIVMDISNTMNDNFGGVTRYAAAMEAAEDFLDNFAANNTLGVSKVGYVAFNTDAHQIFGLQPCTNETQANALKNTMRTQTGAIINANGYSVAHNRFTNVEGGLKMAQDMLNGVSNKNKFIILLTDGFPTTYLESGYKGYDPYDTTGRFYDHVLNVPCSSGTSYSDEAAIRARNMAASIKNSGTTIFSIGVDIGGQTIQAYIDLSEKLANGDAKISIVDRTGTTYEIGDASSTDSYKNWLKNSIGSGYYYDSTNTAGLKDAYNQIFEHIKTTVEAATKADWVATDPVPAKQPPTIEFIGFYDKDIELQTGDDANTLVGSHAVGAEDTATYDTDESAISWDLKESGYSEDTSGGVTTYTYSLKYRVRLENESKDFEEKQIYETNGKTTLQYRTTKTVNGTTTMSDSKTIDFPIPSVHGYLGELEFTKVSNPGEDVLVPGAEFTLSHDIEKCSECRGDGKNYVDVPTQTATSGTDGKVSFANIPSGHVYTLEETGVPDGYHTSGETYQVTVAYDKLSVTVTDQNGNSVEWNGKVVNQMSYVLPKTGGVGTWMYTTGGAALVALWILMYSNKRGRRRNGFH